MVIVKLKFNLVENAKDSLNHAVEHLTDKEVLSTSDYKQIILNTHHAIELLLKECLRRLHPAFIFEDVDKYKSSNPRTVSVEKALDRLCKLDEDIKLSLTLIQTVRDCNKYRNSIVHYEFELSKEEAKAILGRMLSFIFSFAKTNLNMDLESEFRDDKRWLSLVELYDFWDEHGKTLAKKMAEEGKSTIDCPYCAAKTFDMVAKSCSLCGHNDEMIKCDHCKKVIWRGQAYEDSGITGIGENGWPETTYYKLCEKCWNESMADMYAEHLADLERGK